MEAQSNTEIVTLIFAGTTGLLLLTIAVGVMVVLYNRKIIQQKEQKIIDELAFKKKLINATMLSEEKERKEIAKNLHDELGALLSLVRLNEVKISKGIPPDELSDVLDQNKELLNNISEIVRGITNKLYSPILDKFGLIKALDQLSKMISKTGEIHVLLFSQIDTINMPKENEVKLYRVCLEVMNNMVKHSNSKKIHIHIMKNQDLSINYFYDGEGLSQTSFEKLIKQEHKGLGLKSITNRLQMLNGEIAYHKSLNHEKNSVKIKIPSI